MRRVFCLRHPAIGIKEKKISSDGVNQEEFDIGERGRLPG